MNNDIANTLSKYDGQKASEILQSQSLESDIVTIGQSLKTGPLEMQIKARKFFLALLGEIDTRIDELKINMIEHEASMEHIQRISDACIAYMKPTGSTKG